MILVIWALFLESKSTQLMDVDLQQTQQQLCPFWRLVALEKAGHFPQQSLASEVCKTSVIASLNANSGKYYGKVNNRLDLRLRILSTGDRSNVIDKMSPHQ